MTDRLENFEKDLLLVDEEIKELKKKLAEAEEKRKRLILDMNKDVFKGGNVKCTLTPLHPLRDGRRKFEYEISEITTFKDVLVMYLMEIREIFVEYMPRKEVTEDEIKKIETYEDALDLFKANITGCTSIYNVLAGRRVEVEEGNEKILDYVKNNTKGKIKDDKKVILFLGYHFSP